MLLLRSTWRASGRHAPISAISSTPRFAGAGLRSCSSPGLQGSTKYWGSAFDAFASEHRLIFVDALGFGRSPWPREIDYTLDDQVAWLRRTLVAKGATQNVTFVAHSFGTIIAAACAARFPEDVLRVVLLGTPIFASEQQARERIRNMTKLGALFTFSKTLANLSCMTMCAFRPVLRRVLPVLRPGLDPAIVADSVLHDLPAVEGSVNRILLQEKVQDSLRRIGPRRSSFTGATTRSPRSNTRAASPPRRERH